MNPTEFCYWLQGALELAGTKDLSETQVKIIQDHLNLVFKKVTPDRVKTKDSSPDETKRTIQDVIREQQERAKTPSPLSPYKDPYNPYLSWPNNPDPYRLNPNQIICGDGILPGQPRPSGRDTLIC